MKQCVVVDQESVAAHGFDGRDDLAEITLSDRVRRIGSFAFYRCRNLETLRLSDSVMDYDGGAIRECTSLRLIDVTVRHGSFSIIRDLLGDSDAEMIFRIHIREAGQAGESGRELLLVFPSFVSIAEENTMARQINFDIRGSGMGYRETVKRREIRLREYDSLFEGAAVDNVITGAKVALGRLLYPEGLSPAARAKYELFLQERTRDVLLWLAGGKVLTRTEEHAMDLRAAAVAAEPDPAAPAPGEPVLAELTAAELAGFLKREGLVRTDCPAYVEDALRVASERKDPALCAALLEAGGAGRRERNAGGMEFVL